ncbi:MAG: hypothetical protein C0392_00585 [Syntrophus sp. (in: bacteria)]|nr:hypothetical protein [Syntrophus sp. (in: bacteria)]
MKKKRGAMCASCRLPSTMRPTKRKNPPTAKGNAFAKPLQSGLFHTLAEICGEFGPILMMLLLPLP